MPERHPSSPQYSPSPQMDITATVDESISEARAKIIRAIKQHVCAEMGRTGSSLMAIQMFPIAATIAEAVGWDVYQFCHDAGFSHQLMLRHIKHHGCPCCDRRMEYDEGDDSPFNTQDPSYVCLNHGVELVIPSEERRT